ncbi:hypothetical protein ACXAT3_000471 [Clostridium sporogenes]
MIREECYSRLDYIKNSTFDAVYFGGGTPTTLATELDLANF